MVSWSKQWLSTKETIPWFLRAGDELFSIEPVDFELAVERAKANLLKAELDLETVRAQAEIGRTEWQRLHPNEAPNPLVVYAPQLKNAEAGLIAARAAVRQAELDLKRTRITAPFNGFIREEQIDLGQYIKSGNKVGTITGTDSAEIIVPLPLTDLPWLEIPARLGEKGSPVIVTLSAADQQWQWHGWVDRALGEVDPRGRMARLVVIVPDPYGLETTSARKPELAIGSFVDVSLQGGVIPEVVVLPRRALREQDTVWVMTEQNRLQIVPVEVLRREKKVVLVSAGLQGGEMVVLTPLSGAADGLLLRTVEN
jgi:RND family efflux transporter MFP subunit